MSNKNNNSGYVNFQNTYLSSEPFSYTTDIYNDYYVTDLTIPYENISSEELYDYYETLTEEELYATIKSDFNFITIAKMVSCFLELIIAIAVCSTLSINLLNDYFYGSNINIPNNAMLWELFTPTYFI